MYSLPSIPDVDFPTVFKWNNNTISLADVTYRAYLDIFMTAFFQTVEEHDGMLLSSLLSLPNKSQKCIIEAPETYMRLNSVLRNEQTPAWLIEFLGTCVSVERFRLGEPVDSAIHNWSATGDLFCDYEGAADTYSSSGWRTEGNYEAEYIANIPIDHSSIFTRSAMPVAPFRTVRYGDASPFSPNEASNAELKIMNAFSDIQHAVPNASSFIARYVKNIVLRKNIDDLEVFQSASRNSYIGQIVLLNPHGPQVDVSYMAESLVHEAIHSLMWRQEILCHFLIDPEQDMGVAVSPWSGERIFYYTLLQACFVWYGIAHFWHQALDADVFPLNRAEYLFNRAVSGFRNGELISALRTNETNLHSGIMNEFIRMVDTIGAL